jgi:mono/diheme cytochrome c family protein
MRSAAVVPAIGILVLMIGAAAFSGDAALDHGNEVYAMQKCALCHSISGIGGKKMPLDGVGAKLKLEDIKKWIRTPKAMKPETTMKAYPNLPEKDLGDLASFLMSLK